MSLFVNPLNSNGGGSSTVDAYTKTESDGKYATVTALDSKANTGLSYTKTESDGKYATTTALSAKANTTTVYTKTESDAKYATTTALATKADASSVPTKTSQLTNDSNFATVKTRNIITAYPSDIYQLTSDATYETVPLGGSLQVGNAFTITADNGIKFSKTGIVTISLKTTYNSAVTGSLKWATAWLGTTAVSANSVYTDARETLVGNPILLEVTVGQIIYLKVSGSFKDGSGDQIRGGKEYTNITVEYID